MYKLKLQVFGVMLVVLIVLSSICFGDIIFSDLDPNATNFLDGGSSGRKWKDWWLSGTLEVNDVNATGIGRFDGGVGIGSAPAGYGILTIAHSDADMVSARIDNTHADGDSIIELRSGGALKWIMGYDDSDGDKFKIGQGFLGVSDAFEIDTSGNFAFNSGDFTGVGTIACGAITGGAYNGVTLSTNNLLLDDVVNDNSFNVDGDYLFIPTGAGWAISSNGVQLTVGVSSQINQDVRTTASPSFAAIDIPVNAALVTYGDGGTDTLEFQATTATVASVSFTVPATANENSMSLALSNLVAAWTTKKTLTFSAFDGPITFSATGGTVNFNGTGFIFNESGVDADFRLEGDSDANLICTDAGNDRVGIGTSTPDAKLQVIGNCTFGDDTNDILISATGDISFAGSAGFYPRFLTQADEPAAGTGATQCDTSEMVVWKDSDDSTVYLCFNDAGTVKTVALS